MNTCGGSGTHNKTIVLHGTLKLKQQTNADRIRSMTDEELAGWIISITEDDTEDWLDWLKQEVTANDS